MQPAGADCHAQTNLSSSLGYRNEQDVHNADTPDYKRYRGHRCEQERHDTATAFRGLGNLAQISHREIVHVAGPDAMSPDQDFGNLSDCTLNVARTHGLHVDLIDISR